MAILLFAGWSSLAARRAHNPKVVSSNLTPATKVNSNKDYAGIAQLVERQPSKLNVASSNLVSRSKKILW